MIDGAYERQCGGKVLYPDLATAARAAKSMHKKRKAPYNAYQCVFCCGWHVGRQRSAEAAMRRAERRAMA